MVRNLTSAKSEDFSNAAWTKLNTTVVTNQAVAPNGTLTADLVYPATTGVDRVVYQNGLVSSVIGNKAVLAVSAKAAGIRWLWFGTLGGGTAVATICSFDLQNGVVGQVGTYFDSTSIEDEGDGWYRCTATRNSLLAAPLFPIFGLADADGSTTVTANGTDGIYLWGSQTEDVTGQADPSAGEYVSVGVLSAPYHGAGADGVEFFDTDRSGNPIPDATLDGYLSDASVPPDVLAYQTASNILAAAGWIRFEYTPQHTPSGTVFLWGTYVDASNYTAVLHDATNLIFRKRIAGSNYDATITNAFVSGTTYKVAATWGAGGTAIALDGVAGTPHANTTAAQIGATMQWGADGNGGSQPGMALKYGYIGQRQLSASELLAITS